MSDNAEAAAEPITASLRIVHDAWEELRRSHFVQEQMGTPPTRLPDLSFAETERRSKVGLSLLGRLKRVDWSALPHDLALTLRLARFRAQTWSNEADWYWTVIDPRGTGSFGLFLPTAYCGGFFLNVVHGQLSSFPLAESGDADRYLALIADYARLLNQFRERTEGQANRGLRMPKVQVLQGRALLGALKSRAREILLVSNERAAAVRSVHFVREVEERVERLVEPAFDRAIDDLSSVYYEKAPDLVGMSQYPHGEAIYRELVQLHTTLAFTPDQVHAEGIRRMAAIESAMRTIRVELGFSGDGKSFVAHLDEAPAWRAPTAAGVIALFQRYVERLLPHLDTYFSATPKATYSIEPLPKALEGAMTFGYYDAPKKHRPVGTYFFNCRNLTRQSLFNIGALTYHELIPGHHLHLATQQENEALHPLRTYSFINAYNEGWAEYAATLAGEIGLYEQPEERYGRLAMEALLTCRLVVDTGMNVLGWSLDRARQYMREHTGFSEAEILTESVRYSCDIPAQALSYKLGDAYLVGLRERMRRALGDKFDIRMFHQAILEPGALPMMDVEWHVEREIRRLGGTTAVQ